MKKLILELIINVEDEYFEAAKTEMVNCIIVAAQNQHLLAAAHGLAYTKEAKTAEELGTFHLWWAKTLRESLENGLIWVEEYPTEKQEVKVKNKTKLDLDFDEIAKMEKEISEAYWNNVNNMGVQNGPN
jgi:hypothetical protein